MQNTRLCPGLYESDYIRISCGFPDVMLYIHQKFSMVVADAVDISDSDLYSPSDIESFNVQLLKENLRTNNSIVFRVSGHLKTIGCSSFISNILSDKSSDIVSRTFKIIAHGFKLRVKQIQSILSACQINIIDQMDLNRDYIIERLKDLNPASFEIVLNWLSTYIPIHSEELRQFMFVLKLTTYWTSKFTSHWSSEVKYFGNIYVHKKIYDPDVSIRNVLSNMTVEQIDYILDEQGMETCIRLDVVDVVDDKQ